MSQRSARRGKPISDVEVTNISAHGFWVLVGARELFLPFEQFPWFADAPVARILKVEQPGPDHLFWPDLDIDLSIESIEHPEQFPLVSRKRPKKALRPTSRAKRPSLKRARSRAARG
jgi:hypothetical protein